MTLDALIGNTDRHHENWGMLQYSTENMPNDADRRLIIAPSFDHASSLGRELRDEKRAKLLRDGHVGAYVRGGHGGVYLEGEDRRGANPLQIVESNSRQFPAYFGPTLRALRDVSLVDLLAVIEQVPEDRMSDVSCTFAKECVRYSYGALSGLSL
jgi:hypothetical protein